MKKKRKAARQRRDRSAPPAPKNGRHTRPAPPERSGRPADPEVGTELSGNISIHLRGFGFLTCGEGTPDIFVHMETLRRFGMTELRPGQYVLVRFGPGSKGMMAAEIQPETGSPGLSSH